MTQQTGTAKGLEAALRKPYSELPASPTGFAADRKKWLGQEIDRLAAERSAEEAVLKARSKVAVKFYRWSSSVFKPMVDYLLPILLGVIAACWLFVFIQGLSCR